MKQLIISSRLTLRETDSFQQYLKEISKIELFTVESEIACAIKASQGDKTAKEELIYRNLRFVVSVAKQYATSNNQIEDLVSEGNIGLIMAAEKFDITMGFRFISYAVWWIRKIILEHLAKNGHIIRFPANKINGLSKLDKKIGVLEQKLGRNVDIQEIITEFEKKENIDKDDLILLDMLSTYSCDSLDREIGGEEGSTTTLSEMLSDETIFKSNDYFLLNNDMKNEVIRALKTLKPRDKKVMIALYGLDGSTPKTLKEVGDEIDLTREAIRQIKVSALKHLKNKLKNDAELLNWQ